MRKLRGKVRVDVCIYSVGGPENWICDFHGVSLCARVGVINWSTRVNR